MKAAMDAASATPLIPRKIIDQFVALPMSAKTVKCRNGASGKTVLTAARCA